MLRMGCNYFVIVSAILLTAVLAVQPALAVVGIDANVPKDQNTASTTVATAAFSTKSGNELLLVNTQVNSVTGANLLRSGQRLGPRCGPHSCNRSSACPS